MSNWKESMDWGKEYNLTREVKATKANIEQDIQTLNAAIDSRNDEIVKFEEKTPIASTKELTELRANIKKLKQMEDYNKEAEHIVKVKAAMEEENRLLAFRKKFLESAPKEKDKNK